MRVIVAISIVLLMGCSKEESSNTVDSYGDRIVSLLWEGSGLPNMDTFIYVDDTLRLIRESLTDIQLKYQGGLLQNIHSISRDDSLLYAIDSIEYNGENMMMDVTHYTLNLGDSFVLDRRYHFDYNTEGQVLRKTIYSSAMSISLIYEYEWEENNVISKMLYDPLRNLMSENKYEYDSYRNYRKQDLRLLHDMRNWNANNIIRTVNRDYTGLVEYYCFKCITEYKYNLDGYPVVHKFDWGDRVKIEYQ